MKLTNYDPQLRDVTVGSALSKGRVKGIVFVDLGNKNRPYLITEVSKIGGKILGKLEYVASDGKNVSLRANLAKHYGDHRYSVHHTRAEFPESMLVDEEEIRRVKTESESLIPHFVKIITF